METRKFDTKEFELPETVFIRDIEDKVLRGIVLQCLLEVEGVAPVEGTFIDSIFGRTGAENIAGITIEQNTEKHSVGIKIEINVRYGVSLPEKAEEIQTKVAEAITRLTGLHVASIHVVFKGITSGTEAPQQMVEALEVLLRKPTPSSFTEQSEYNDDF